MSERLYRSRDDRMIAGVAGGIAERLSIDPTIVRVIWAVLVLPHRLLRAAGVRDHGPGGPGRGRTLPSDPMVGGGAGPGCGLGCSCRSALGHRHHGDGPDRDRGG